MPPASTRSTIASAPTALGLAGVEEQQRERALVEQRRPVRGEHLDLGVVGEDLRRGLGQLGVELGADGCGRLADAGAQPGGADAAAGAELGQRAARGWRPGWPAAGRSRCGRTRRSRPSRETSKARCTTSGRSGGALMLASLSWWACASRIAERFGEIGCRRVLRAPYRSSSCGACSYLSTAAAGPDSKATSPRCSALRALQHLSSSTRRGGTQQHGATRCSLLVDATGPHAIRGDPSRHPPPGLAALVHRTAIDPQEEKFRCTTCTPTGARASHQPENPRSHEARPGLARPAGQRRRAPRRQLAFAHVTTAEPTRRSGTHASPSSPATASGRRSSPRRSRSSRRPRPPA